MKKIFFLGLGAMGMLISCSNDEVIEVADNPQDMIGFSGTFVNNSTRATYANVLGEKIYDDGFSVYGTMFNPNDESTAVAQIFANQSVTYSNATSKWSYTPLRYWTPNNNYSFSAFAPTTGAGWTFNDNADNSNYLIPHGTLAFSNTDGNQDFGYAFATRTTASNNETPVNLSFNHMLSKVNVKFLNSFATANASLVISDLKIVSFNGGNYDFSQLSSSTVTNAILQATNWTFDGYTANGLTVAYTFANEAGTASVNNSLAFNNTSHATTDNFFFLMPSQQSITVKFNVELFSNGVSNGNWDHTVDVSLSENDALVFKPGCSYTLVASINQDNVADQALNPIVFSASVNDWESDTDVNVPLLGINALSTNLAANGTFQIVPNVTCGNLVEVFEPAQGIAMADGTYWVAYSYTSDNAGVATVNDSGLITAVGTGTAKVTVTATITKYNGAVFTRSKDVTVEVGA